MALIHTPQIADPDDFFAEMVATQRDMDDAQAQRWLASLVLLLANHIGDRAVLSAAMAQAARTATRAY